MTELAGWFLLLASGIVGVNKLEWLPNIILVRDKAQNQKKVTRQFTEQAMKTSKVQLVDEEGKDTEMVSVSSLVKQSQDREQMYKDMKDELATSHSRKNTFQRWAFYIGIIFLAVSRSSEHILQIYFST